MLGIGIVYKRAKFYYYSFSRCRDMVDAHQYLNGSRDLTTLLSGMICHPRLALTTINLSTKLELSISTHYEDIKSDTKNGNGVVWGSKYQGH